MKETRVMLGHAQAEITEKRSRFIANVYEIHSEEEALQIFDLNTDEVLKDTEDSADAFGDKAEQAFGNVEGELDRLFDEVQDKFYERQ